MSRHPSQGPARECLKTTGLPAPETPLGEREGLRAPRIQGDGRDLGALTDTAPRADTSGALAPVRRALPRQGPQEPVTVPPPPPTGGEFSRKATRIQTPKDTAHQRHVA